MIFCWLLLLVPLSLISYLLPASPIWVFITAAAAIIPLAEWIRRATDQMAKLAGPAIGGLLNVTLGNTAEFVLAIFVLSTGASEVVKGQITGAIVGNGLLGLGLAVLIGTWGRDKLTFPREHAGLLSSLLILVVIALLVPALFDYTERAVFHDPNAGLPDERLSLGVSAVLVLVYVANLFYTLLTHRDVFAIAKEKGRAEWSWWRAAGVLAAATVATAWESYLISGDLESAAGRAGLSPFFLGVVVLALVGNFPEYFAAVYFAHKGQMTLAMSITIGSTIQIALLVAPLLVFISFLIGHPMNLVFANPLELVAIASVAFAVNAIAHDGEATWFEGVMLLSIYAILSMAFFFVAG